MLIPAGEWKGQRSPRPRRMDHEPLEGARWRSTRQLATQFNPVKFNADEWVQLAQDAGMKYIVITSKHHDGFAMFKSAASTLQRRRRDAVQARHPQGSWRTPARSSGMRLGFYYSQSQDWHEKDGAGNTWDFGPDQGPAPDDKELKNYDAYLRGKAEPQVKELLTRLRARGAHLVRHAAHDDAGARPALRRHRPRRRSRTRSSTAASAPKATTDRTGDNVIPPEASAEAWETPATINDTWGFRKDDTNWKSAGADRVQARRHRQQGRQLPAERRPDGGRGRSRSRAPTCSARSDVG